MAAIRIVPLEREHIPNAIEKWANVVLSCESYAVFRGEAIIAAFGATELWPGRGWAWITNDSMSPREWFEISIKCRDMDSGFRRLETLVADGFEEGHRWAERCGFKKETLCKNIMPDGSDGWFYVRTDNGPTP